MDNVIVGAHSAAAQNPHSHRLSAARALSENTAYDKGSGILCLIHGLSNEWEAFVKGEMAKIHVM